MTLFFSGVEIDLEQSASQLARLELSVQCLFVLQEQFLAAPAERTFLSDCAHECSTARMAQHDTARSGLACSGLLCLSLSWPGLVWPNLVYSGIGLHN